MNNLLIHFLLFIIVSSLWYFGLLIFSLPLLVLYLYFYQGFELIALGVMIDLQFLSYIDWPWYTILAVGAVVLAMIIKPRLLVYTTKA